MGAFLRNRLDRVFLFGGGDDFFASSCFRIALVALGAFFLYSRLDFLAAIRLGV